MDTGSLIRTQEAPGTESVKTRKGEANKDYLKEQHQASHLKTKVSSEMTIKEMMRWLHGVGHRSVKDWKQTA